MFYKFTIREVVKKNTITLPPDDKNGDLWCLVQRPAKNGRGFVEKGLSGISSQELCNDALTICNRSYIYMCMYVCMYACMHACMYVYYMVPYIYITYNI